VKTKHLWFVVPLLACAKESGGNEDSAGDSGIDSLSASASASASETDASATTPTGDDSISGEGTGIDDDGPDDDGTVFDVGMDSFCKFKEPGIYCEDNYATECGENGTELGNDNCDPDICVPGVGCVVCTAGQHTCMGDKVMVCNDAMDPPAWQVSATCDPGSNQGCVITAGVGSCQPLVEVGGVTPTGEYYQFAEFLQNSTPFLGGYDVDGFDDKLYVLNYSNSIDVYSVALEDTDMDGELEPNQHPDNPEEQGAIENRTLTYVETIPTFGTPQLSSSEIYALADRVYIGGTAITENVLGVGTSVITTPPAWTGRFAQIGYDDVHGVWYASTESWRRVLQYCAETNTWGIAFYYPPLAGDHMDGLEVVTDPNTGIPYVYVSDMTSDFIGQYRLDSEDGWVQENLFSYAGTAGVVVEGMGFGPLYHFWATAGSSVYEVGGGDLSDYTDPPG
jgi:hypothetical protein